MARSKELFRTRRRSRPSLHYLVNLGLVAALFAIVTGTGVRFLGFTSAATINPYGFADFCTLENNTTVIYGWAADPNATALSQPLVTLNAGGQAVTVPTSQAGYRDTPINAWIDANRAGDPKPGTYGFRAPLAGLYKGTRNVITGSVINEGPGSSVILTVNSSGPTDGVAGRPYFAGGVIPDACLANRPVPPPTTPVTPPTPPVSPSPGPRPQPGGANPTPTPPASQPPATTLTNTTDAEVTTGSLAVSFKVPAGGASNMRVLYGTNPLAPDQATNDQAVQDGTATFLIAGLDPKATYSYQIVRFDAAGRTSTSPIGTFKTRGFTVAVHFRDAQNKGKSGIPVTISDLKDTEKTTGSNGTVRFDNISAGSHTVSFTYGGRKHQELVTATAATVNPESAGQPKSVTIDHSVNVSKLPAGDKITPPKEDKAGMPAAILLGLVALAIMVIYAIYRRRSRNYYPADDNAPPPPLPEYSPPKPAKEEPIDVSQIPVSPRQQGAEHMGESLKEMVLRSMAEEAKRRQDIDPKR